jgi:hypothetical protein
LPAAFVNRVDDRRRAAGGRDGLAAVPAAVAGEDTVAVVVHLQRQADLFQVVAAGDAAGSLAHLLHGGKEEGQQDGDDGDDHEQFDQREGTPRRQALTDHGSTSREQ